MKTIAQITDIHLDEQFPIDQGVDARKNWQVLLEDVAARGIEEIVFTGDIGEKSANAWFFDTLKRHPSRFKVILGNHDDFSEATKYYQKETPGAGNELYYTCEDDHYKYLFMDSSGEKISAAQFAWLQQELNTTKKIILFIHHPVLGVDTPVDKKYPLAGREQVSTLLQQHPGEVFIFCGHYHMADEQTAGNIKQWITPAGSYQIKKQSGIIEVETDTFGYRIIRVDGTGPDTEVVSVNTDNYHNYK